MKRDINLVRELLLYFEEITTVSTFEVAGGDVQKYFEKKGFSDDQVDYHVALLHDAELILASNPQFIGQRGFWIVGRLTWKGHEYLEVMRDKSKWKKALAILKKFKVTDLESIVNIILTAQRSTVIEELLSQHLFQMK